MPKLPVPRTRSPLQLPTYAITADVVVAGAGLAGASAALVLGRDRQVVLLDAEAPAAGASGAAAGLVNPFMGRKARPAWRYAQALDALHALLDEADALPLLHRVGVLRPADSGRQAAVFAERADEHPDDLEWWTADDAGERWPHVTVPNGALFVRRGGHLDVGHLVRALVAAARARGVQVETGRALVGWRTELGAVAVSTRHGPLRCRHLLLTLGDGARHLPGLDGLPLARVKGQILRLARPPVLPDDHPAVAGRGYVVPRDAEVVVGATFEHTFTSEAPDPARDAGLLASAAQLVPALDGAQVLGRLAGVRLGVPATVSPRRLPLAGPLPGHPGVWILTGLGSKGLLTAPLLASLLPGALDGRALLPAETRPPAGP